MIQSCVYYDDTNLVEFILFVLVYIIYIEDSEFTHGIFMY